MSLESSVLSKGTVCEKGIVESDEEYEGSRWQYTRDKDSYITMYLNINFEIACPEVVTYQAQLGGGHMIKSKLVKSHRQAYGDSCNTQITGLQCPPTSGFLGTQPNHVVHQL